MTYCRYSYTITVTSHTLDSYGFILFYFLFLLVVVCMCLSAWTLMLCWMREYQVPRTLATLTNELQKMKHEYKMMMQCTERDLYITTSNESFENPLFNGFVRLIKCIFIPSA